MDASDLPIYDVRLSEAAEADIDTMMLRQGPYSPNSADRWHQAFVEAYQTLEQLPNRCPFAPENGKFDRPIRQLLFRQGQTAYRILFMVFEADEDEPRFVRIMRILYGVQPWDQPQRNNDEI